MLGKIISVWSNQGFLRYLKNTSWMMAEQILRIIAGLFVGIWVARYLGPEQFGLFSYVIALTAILGGIAKLGLDGVLVRELIERPEETTVYLGTAFWLKLFGALLLIGLMTVIVPYVSSNDTESLYILIILAGLVFQSFEVVEFYFQSHVKAKIISICKVIQLMLSSVAKIYLVIIEADLLWFVSITMLDAVSLAISYFFAYKLNKNQSFYRHFDFHVALRLLKDSWPLIFTSVVVMIYMRIDQIMIKEMLGEYEVGIYSAAVRLSEAFYFIPMIISASLFPAILNAKRQSEELYHHRLQQLYTLMVWLSIGLAVIMTIMSDFLVVLLFGEAYQESANSLKVLTWAGVFVFLGVAFSKYLLAENMAMISFQRTCAGAIANIVLNYVLIPIYGIMGSALATLLAQFIANYVFDLFDPRMRSQFILKNKAIFMPHLVFRVVRGND